VSPLVSIVVPAFQNAAFIDRTLASILAQTHTDLDVVVADHSSTDGTWEALQAYADDPRVRLLRTPAGGGAPANWRRVTAEARGDFVKLVCGDDLIDPELVAEQVRALSEHPEAAMAACRRDIIDANDAVVFRGRGLAGLSGRVAGVKALRRTVVRGTNIFGEPGCVLFRREVFERVGGWDARFPYLIDEATYARVLLEGDLVAVDRSLAAFRISSGQWSVALVREQAEQATAFHRWLHETRPDVVSASQLRRGNLAARLNARARRATYQLLARRMGDE
jgi:Predicted glycosyltransferases